jgi:hypothetical protein
MPVIIAAVVLGVAVLAVLLVKRGAKGARARAVSQLRSRYPENMPKASGSCRIWFFTPVTC